MRFCRSRQQARIACGRTSGGRGPTGPVPIAARPDRRPEHPLAKLAGSIDWRFLEQRFGAVYSDKAGHPPLPTRLMAGLAILKHMHDLSDEELCERWVENPYYQLFCGEEFFRHKLPFDRSSLTRWRQRMGEEKLTALMQESLRPATRTGAAKPADFTQVIVDTTVQPKAVAFPTDARLLHRARERLVRLAKKHGVRLRQSYERVGKLRADRPSALRPRQAVQARQPGAADVPHLSRPGHPRHRPQDRRRRQPARDLRPAAVASPRRVREQRQQPARTARSIPCTRPRSNASAKARRIGPTSSASRSRSPPPLHRSKGGQFVAHVTALPGNPYDGHTLATVIPEIEPPDRRDADPRRRRPRLSRPQRAARPARSASISRARSAASPTPSSANCAADPPSSRSSATSRPSTAWAATTSPGEPATPPTPSSPPSATTSAA